MKTYLRGRPPGEVLELLDTELRRCGATEEHLLHADSEVGAAQAALAWAEPGDLVLFIVHSERDRVVALLERR